MLWQPRRWYARWTELAIDTSAFIDSFKDRSPSNRPLLSFEPVVGCPDKIGSIIYLSKTAFANQTIDSVSFEPHFSRSYDVIMIFIIEPVVQISLLLLVQAIFFDDLIVATLLLLGIVDLHGKETWGFCASTTDYSFLRGRMRFGWDLICHGWQHFVRISSEVAVRWTTAIHHAAHIGCELMIDIIRMRLIVTVRLSPWIKGHLRVLHGRVTCVFYSDVERTHHIHKNKRERRRAREREWVSDRKKGRKIDIISTDRACRWFLSIYLEGNYSQKKRARWIRRTEKSIAAFPYGDSIRSWRRRRRLFFLWRAFREREKEAKSSERRSRASQMYASIYAQ